MRSVQGNISKMKTALSESEVYYKLTFSGQEIDVNELIGRSISLNFLGKINCVKCGAETNKSFSQGFCYKCFVSAPETEECVLHPEKCKAHFGIARDIEFAQSHCLIPHYVYLALSSSVKVGVTRSTQIPTRWIDQGAWKAVILAETPNRHTAGIIEVYLKNHLSDKTNWRSLLKNELASDVDLFSEKKRIIELLPSELKKYVSENDEVLEINYPVNEYLIKPKTVTFDKEKNISGVLKGIKGQYLLLDDDRAFNVRRHSGYLTELVVND